MPAAADARAASGRAATSSTCRRSSRARLATSASRRAAPVAPTTRTARRAFADVEPSQPSPQQPPPPPPPAPARPPSNITPDAVLTAPGGVPIYVYGTEHAAADPGVGAAILGAAPAAVVVETSLSPAHGAARGAAISGLAPWPPPDAPQATRDAAAADPEGEAVVEQARGLGAQLAARMPPVPLSLPSPAPASGPLPMDWSPFGPGASALWDALAGHFAGEQLACIAALACGARLVHGDRPKRLTLARLARGGSLAALDAAVGAANAANYAAIAAGGDAAPEPPRPEEQAGSAFKALLLERDACLCSTLAAEAASSAATAASRGDHPRPVVAVVGAWHVAGLEHLWAGGAWKGLLAEAEAEPPTEEAWGAAEAARSGGALSPAAALGAGRALVNALLAFTATADGGVGEVDSTAGACPGGAEGAAAAAAVGEVWGSTRSLLAALPPGLLPRIASGWRCDLSADDGPLAPLRAVRPVNGGPGWSDPVLASLRGLHFLLWK